MDNVDDVVAVVNDAVQRARFLVALTGAGISCASGLPLVTDKIEGIPLREFFRPDCIDHTPERFYNAYRHILHRWRAAKPNAAHHALAEKDVWVITQNIDGLHRDAGSERLLELHGNLRELICAACDDIYQASIVWAEPVPHCPRCGAMLYPGITLEGEEVRHWSRAVDWIGRAEVLFIIGTSLEMFPETLVPQMMNDTGGTIIRINESAEYILPRLLK